MQTGLRGRDLISLQEWTTEEIDTILEVASQLKRERALGVPHPLLRDRVLAMLFFFSSTRTRASFEAGMAQLGGHAQFIESRTTQIAHGDTAKEIGEILGRYNDGIAIRNVDWGIGNAYIREVAEASRVPVLNMQCDLYHPHQVLADLMTIREKIGDPRGKTITVSWAYAASYQKPISVPQDLILLATRYGMNVRLVHPPEFKLMPEIVEAATDNARRSGGSLELMDDFDAGFRDSDVVYAKSWGALLTAADEADGAAIANRYTQWITDERRMALAGDGAIYMHPLPADRNVEVADAVIDGPQSVVYDEAENRLHAQKAVMALTMG
jgi:N-acetylornithine carbamoyltransferase